ncbi:MAG: hypothetical protein LUE23_03125 [Lachnospiraceae bacterium]|nr:hypothetical protein [Lachnospiraceae bacterium]
MRWRIVRADPAGNITLFVLDPVPREDRALLAARLMKQPQWGAEQVGFVCPPVMGGAGRLEMMGGEFCGNAARAFGMMISQEQGCVPRVTVEISGCSHPVAVEVDWQEQTAFAQMPLPRAIRPVTVCGIPCTLVEMEGISHVVAEDVAPDITFFRQAEELFSGGTRPDAYGVIFVNRAEGRMTPIVRVFSTDTTVWEGSCGSGTLAAAAALSRSESEGTFCCTLVQPAGTLTAEVTRREGRIVAASLGGSVMLSAPEEFSE